ncbi:MAG: Fe-S cluster assembly ATPase SufC [Candidatus Moranbacteria bacterium]|nr:Fe-S cluster assembly ATPase SufC [Candidatus Moranbacteria bacterium]
MLSIKNLTTKANKKTILKNITATFQKGKIYAVMGVNGSGKSTLVKTIMGDPLFTISQNSEIKLNEKSIKNIETNERAEQGIFASIQSPPEISGVTIKQLLRAVTKNKSIPAKELLKKISLYAEELKIPEELLDRSLNEGFSGGERKKMELLQMAILDPEYIFLDEIDTGVDVDAIKTISTFLKNFIRNTEKTLVIITHQNKIFKELKPDHVLVLKDGEIIKEGDFKLIEKIEKEGFDKI